MDAVCAKVEAANKLGDPLEAFPVFKKYDRNGLNVSIECKRVSSLDPATLDWAFELTKVNMQTLYEQSEWGWKDREKRDEMTDDRAWYLIALKDGSVPVAFSHFRFDVECGEEVLYCYEVQLESKVRRKGLGKFLIQILQLVANGTQMKKVMLTVFKHNRGAYQFFREALQFEIDDASPSMSGCCGEDCSYEILSRRTKFGSAPKSFQLKQTPEGTHQLLQQREREREIERQRMRFWVPTQRYMLQLVASQIVLKDARHLLEANERREPYKTGWEPIVSCPRGGNPSVPIWAGLFLPRWTASGEGNLWRSVRAATSLILLQVLEFQRPAR
ncbi:N-alpha-acetyltransferase 40 isoform X3 [Hemicordylus capensis]|nr:N-alpha-acetyltransferase 40 isoform X3 [Hemicordylus capensis]XP_053134501.1 N-alpha-acetyltransferase 40 isoform X3 [Hemicordylus capensis]